MELYYKTLKIYETWTIKNIISINLFDSMILIGINTTTSMKKTYARYFEDRNTRKLNHNYSKC